MCSSNYEFVFAVVSVRADKAKGTWSRGTVLISCCEQGLYDDLLSRVFADGHRLMPRELATLVHSESTFMVDVVTERCLEIGEGIVWEGTFSWPGLGRRLLTDLAEADYQKLTFLDVEAPVDFTKARLLARWRGRETAVRGGDDFGGRFAPAFVIDVLYSDAGAVTVCASNARAASDGPLAAEIPTVELLVRRGSRRTGALSTLIPRVR